MKYYDYAGITGLLLFLGGITGLVLNDGLSKLPSIFFMFAGFSIIGFTAKLEKRARRK